MPLVDVGKDVVLNLILAAFDVSNAYLGVGDSTDPHDDAQTDLQAATNKAYFPVDSVVIDGDAIEWQVAVGPSDANFFWEEMAVFDADPSAGPAVMLGRKVDSHGEKVSGDDKTLKYRHVLT